MDASQNRGAYLRGDRDLKRRFPKQQYLISLGKRILKCTAPTLKAHYMWSGPISNIPEIWSTWAILHMTSLIFLCNLFSVVVRSRLFIVGMYAFGVHSIVCFFFPQSDLVAMTSIGKYISLCLEYLWSVYFQ